jgi:enoyl-CoA hydratase/carnithine racemase
MAARPGAEIRVRREAKMTAFEGYKDRFKFVRFERQDGVLEVAIHRDGGEALWEGNVGGIHDELGEAFRLVARDPEVRVMILTGSGDAFCAKSDHTPTGETMDARWWDRIYREGKDLLMNLLDIEVPVVGAVNGDALLHAELVVLSDIVIAAEGARFADKAHGISGVTPGDGVHVVWPMLLGPNRARHFLLTGAEIEASEAQRLGIVAEVLPKGEVRARAWAIAHELAAKPKLMLRYSKIALTLEIKRRLLADLGYGLALEGLGALDMISGRRD